jgi:hypothetical protein
MYISAKDVVKIRKFSIDLLVTKLNLVESEVNFYMVPRFVKDISLMPWYDMFDIFPRYYITYHDSMCTFPIFSNFLNYVKFGSNRGNHHVF